MEFHIRLTRPLADLRRIEAGFQALDAAAQIDVDEPRRLLRIAAHVDAAELMNVLNRAGYPVPPGDVVQLPSICFGGCGG